MSALAALVLAAVTVADGQTLFFSQFQEASSGNNKYFQIYNRRADIDRQRLLDRVLLQRLRLRAHVRGRNHACQRRDHRGRRHVPRVQQRHGGRHFVAATRSSATPMCRSTAMTSMRYIGHGLLDGDLSDIVDQIGLFSETDPGSNWPVCGTSSGLDTQNGLPARDRRAAATRRARRSRTRSAARASGPSPTRRRRPRRGPRARTARRGRPRADGVDRADAAADSGADGGRFDDLLHSVRQRRQRRLWRLAQRWRSRPHRVHCVRRRQ